MRIIVGISGASGVLMGYRLMEALRAVPDMEIHLIMTDGAALTFGMETTIPLSEIKSLADVVHDNRNLAATISSGSFKTDGMIIMPCSMKTMAGIASGYAENLLLRAADVCLKEGRKVVVVPAKCR